MSSVKVEAVFRDAGNLTEGPHWVQKQQTLMYVDVFDGMVHMYNPVKGEDRAVNVGIHVSSVIPVQGHQDKYVIARGRELACLQWDGQSDITSIQPITTLDDEEPSNLLNDGKCDAHGRLWIGSYSPVILKNPKVAKGSLFSLEPDVTTRKHLSGIRLSNGISWSPDNSIMYYIDSLTYTLDAFDFSLHDGNISNRRVVFDFQASGIEGYPDGLTVDTKGNIWVALLLGGQVVCIDPVASQIVTHVEMPCIKTTSVMFGGVELDELYVTSGYDDDAEKGTLSGSLFRVTGTGAKGLPATECAVDLTRLKK